jgi:branched-chain amino acid transport system permease protein
VEILIYGLINSMLLVLMAVGFALAYSVSRVPNFMHGALYVLTGYLAWVFLNRLGLGYLPSVVLSIAVVTLIGWVVYRVAVIRVRGMPVSEIIVTFAISLAVLEFLRWLGLRGATYVLPAFYIKTVILAGVPIDFQRIAAVIVATAIVIVLWIFTHYTKMGLGLRGIAQNERAALLLGIDSDRAATLALSLGSALAAVAGITIIPMGNINVATGYDVLVFAIAVCICGGLGSWTGTILAAFIIGFAQTIVVYLIAPHLAMVVALAAVILILIFKPSGLFGRQKELEERV